MAALALLATASCNGNTTFHQVSEGDIVRFREGREAPPPAWVMPDFDDSGWKSGPSPVGIGKRVTTRVDGMGRDFATLYVRVPFDLGPTAAAMTTLNVSTPVLGGGYVLYVNGVEVARDGIAEGAPADQNASSVAEVKELTIDVPAGTLRPQDNMIAVEARCPPLAEDVSVGFTVDALEPAAASGIVRGPYLQMTTSTGATVVFETADAVEGRVVVGKGVFTGPAATHHEIAVTGLAPGTSINYRVEAGGSRSEQLELQTLPAAGETVRFLVYGDTRTNGDTHRRLTKVMAAEGAPFAINTGDLVATGGDDPEWDAFFSIEYALLSRMALFPAVGNHETNGSGGVDNFKDFFALPKNPGSPAPERLYAFDAGDVHFVAIDSNLTLASQAAWIEADVLAARARGARHVFFFLHHGPYSAGSKHGGSSSAQSILAPMARRLGVDAIFSGHDHIYERGMADGLRYFVSGGGGAPLHSVNPLRTTQHAESRTHYILVETAGDRVRIEAKGIDGTVFDTAEWSAN
jgi:acid phosphatase type 7